MFNIFQDNFKEDPYWWDDAPPLKLTVNEIPRKVDVVIIGDQRNIDPVGLEPCPKAIHTLFKSGHYEAAEDSGNLSFTSCVQKLTPMGSKASLKS